MREISYKWNVFERWVSKRAQEGRIHGMEQFNWLQAISKYAEKPADPRKEKSRGARLGWQNQNADGFINAMKGFNAMYRFYEQDMYKMAKLDTSAISLEESSRQVMDWIISHIQK